MNKLITSFLFISVLLSGCSGNGPTHKQTYAEEMNLSGNVEGIFIVHMDERDGDMGIKSQQRIAGQPYIYVGLDRNGNIIEHRIYQVDTIESILLNIDSLTISPESGLNYYDARSNGRLDRRIVTDEQGNLKRIVKLRYENGDISKATAYNFRFKRKDLAIEYEDTLLVTLELYDLQDGPTTIKHTYDDNGNLSGSTVSIPDKDIIRFISYDSYERISELSECSFSDISNVIKQEEYEYRGGENNYRIISKIHDLGSTSFIGRNIKKISYYKNNVLTRREIKYFLCFGINMKADSNEHGDLTAYGRKNNMAISSYEYDDNGNWIYREVTYPDGHTENTQRFIKYYDN